MSKRWIKLHTKFQKWSWYKDGNTCRLFIHLLLNANWKNEIYNDSVIMRGSLITTRKKLSSELGLSEREIRTALQHLQTTNEIAIKTTNKFSIITISNYAFYQNSDQQNDQQNDLYYIDNNIDNNVDINNNKQISNEKIIEIYDYDWLKDMEE